MRFHLAANEDLGLKSAYRTIPSETLSFRAGASLRTIAKSELGAITGCLRLSTLLAFLAVGFFVAATSERAEAQFNPWGGWGNPAPWQPKPRRLRRAPRNVDPSDDKPIVSTLPRPSGPLVIVVSIGKQTVTVYDDGKVIA